MSRIFHLYAAFFAKTRFVLAFGLVAITIASIFGYLQPKPALFSGVQALESRDPKTRDSDRLFKEIYDQFDIRRPDAILVMESQDPFSPADIRAMRAALGEVKRLPYIDSAIWLEDLPPLNVFAIAEPILPDSDATDASFADVPARVRRNPLAAGQLVTSDGSLWIALLRMDFVELESDKQLFEELLPLCRQQADLVGKHSVTFRLTGDIPLYVDQVSAHRRNQRIFEIIGYSLAFILALILYRGIWPVILVCCGPVLGIFWTMGFMRLWGEPQNPLTDSVLPVLLAMVGITDGVHLAANVRRALAEGYAPLAATVRAIEHAGLACFLTSATTAIGFASLLITDSQMVYGFGKACSIGVMLTFVSVVVLIPLLTSSFGSKYLLATVERDWFDKLVLRFSVPYVQFLIRHAKGVVCFFVIFTIIAFWVACYLRPDAKQGYGMPVGSETYKALMLCDQKLGGIESAQVVITWPESEDPRSEKLLQVSRQVDSLLQKEPLVAGGLSLAKLVDAFPIEQVRDSDRMGFLDLLPSPIRDAVYDKESRRCIVSFRLQDRGIAVHEPMLDRLSDEFNQLESQFPGFEIAATGDAVVRGRKVANIVGALLWSIISAAIIIFACLGFAFRSLRLGLIAIPPNVLPVVGTASFVLLIGRQLDIAAACALVICLGIAVDDTIHYMARYIIEREAGKSRDEALLLSFQKVGGALIVTTIIMVVGFSTVLVSEMPTQWIFGTMSMATLTFALIGDLAMLPAMLAIFDRDKPSKSE